MDPINNTPPRRLLCPQERYEREKNKEKVIKIGGKINSYRIIKSPYYITDADAENFKPLHSLIESEYGWQCLACYDYDYDDRGNSYYVCTYCKPKSGNWDVGGYHKICVESPPSFHSYYHPKHPLQLIRFISYVEEACFSCQQELGNGIVYYCFVCDFKIHPFCAIVPETSLTIFNPKRHNHTLQLFPRNSYLVCDVCGLANNNDYRLLTSLYICLQCDFIVHKRCVDLPYVIKVSRHNHRLTFTPNLPYEEEEERSIDCGVCHEHVDKRYGEYSCTKKECIYAVHSQCAMRKNVCDGKELEGKPEETYENTKMYEDINDGIILSHPNHHMKLLDKKIQSEEMKHCQACRNLFTSDDDGNIYRCLQCDDFILHESCAYLPRVLQFMLHLHPLNLELGYITSGFRCAKCRRYSSGFAYVSPVQDNFKLDTVCASISEPFQYHSHPHPLFITDESKRCCICSSIENQPLYCVKCKFVLCFHCATLPHKARYEHDAHMLIFKFVEDGNDDDEIHWCEICEKDINPKFGLYECNECEVRLHIDCLLGRDPYMKPGQSLAARSTDYIVYVLPNNYSTRPLCFSCRRRCPYRIKIQIWRGFRRTQSFCSFGCYPYTWIYLE